MAKGKGAVPPNNIPAEMIVLGAMLESAEAVDKGLEILKSEHFYRETHRLLFETMLKLHGKGEPVNPDIVYETVKGSDKVEVTYLYDLCEKIASPVQIEEYAPLVLRAWQRRRAREIAMVLHDRIMSAPVTDKPDEIIAEAENGLGEVLNLRTVGGPQLIGPVMNSELLRVGNLPKDGMTGLPTGLKTLDRMTGGWQNGEMIILAGRPKEGKTNTGLSFARTLAFKHNVPVQFFSMEMKIDKIAQRIQCSLAGVDSNKFRRNDITKEEAESLNE